MSVASGDIFPLLSGITKILEPHKCEKILTFPSSVTSSEARVIFRTRLSKPFARIKYEYENIMTWEYRIIEQFYRNMKGEYDDFYVVNWSDQYRVTTIPTGESATYKLTLDHVAFLQSRSGYLGNTVLLYNPTLTGTKHQILTIASGGLSAGTTVTFNEIVTENLRTLVSRAYILYPSIFEGNMVQPTSNGICIEKEEAAFFGYDTSYVYGPIYNVPITFISLGVVYE